MNDGQVPLTPEARRVLEFTYLLHLWDKKGDANEFWAEVAAFINMSVPDVKNAIALLGEHGLVERIK